MGFFDSKKTTTNQNITTNNTESNQQSGQLNLAKNSVMNGNVSISNGVIETNEEMRKLGESAFGFGGQALSEAFEFGDNVIESNNGVINQGFDFAESLVNQQTANSNNTTLAINDLAKSLASGGASDANEVSKKAIYALGAVVVAVLLVVLVKGR